MAKKKILAMISVLIVLLMIWTFWGNTALELNKYEVVSENLPKAFDGFKIVQVSDLHNAEIGDNNEKLIAIIEEAEPDIIAITGDMIDSRRTDIDVALEFAAQAVKIAPCYYVNGNHEMRIAEYDILKEGLIDLGVTILENEKQGIIIENQEISVIGISDPSFEARVLLLEESEIVDNQLDVLTSGDDSYKVVLSHRPELFDIYCEAGADVVLTGHAHGGQVRLPIVGGIIAPHQGFFPKYDSGLYIKEETNMVVSRGIGNSLFPLRFNNRPEVVLIELQAR